MTGPVPGAARRPCPRCGWARPPRLFPWPDDDRPVVEVCYSCWTVLHTPGAICAADVGCTCLAERKTECGCRTWQAPTRQETAG